MEEEGRGAHPVSGGTGGDGEPPAAREAGEPPGPREAGEPPAPAEAGKPPPLPNLAVRSFQVFVSPGELFERLRERPAWTGALLLLVALNVLGALLLPDELLRQLVEARIPPDAEPEALETGLRFLRLWGIVGAALGPPVVAALLAVFLLVVYNVFLGGEATYRQLLAVTVHALIVLTVGGFLTLLLMIAQGEVGAALALHLLVPGLEPGGWPYRFLHGLNVFGLWTAVLLGIGVGRVYPRRDGSAAAALLVGLYAALKAAAALFPTLSGP